MAAPQQNDKPQHIEFYGGYQVYSECGVDLTLLRQNLSRSLAQGWGDACHGAAIFTAFGRARRILWRKPRYSRTSPYSTLKPLLGS